MDPTAEPETRDDMHPRQPIMEHERMEGMSAPQQRSTLGKRRRSSQSSDGGEEDAGATENVEMEDVGTLRNDSAHSRPTPGTLQERRASTSPQKFNQGRFEPLAVQTSGQHDRPAAKKMRVENKVDITYDRTGTPILSSFPLKSCDETPHDHIPSSGINSTRNATAGPTTSKALSTASSAVSIQPPTSKPSSTSHQLSSPTPRLFNLISALCRDNDLLLHLVSYLNIPSLIRLYSISKPFHYLFNRHHTAFILSCMRTWAPGADTIFPWRCYKSMCVKDPSKRQKKRLEGKEDDVKKKWDDLRDVPSLRWLQMVVWREGVCKDMCIQLAVNGLRAPPGTLDALKRMWFLMDLPLNAHRIALIHTPAYISDQTLHRMTNFMLKVDMLFTDPFQPPYPVNHPDQRSFPRRLDGGAPSGVPLRKMLLAERHLTPLWRVLRGWNWDPTQPRIPMTRLDVLRLWVRHRYTHPEDTPEDVKKQSIMSIPWWEVGAFGYERTGVSFLNLTEDKQVAITHPSISGKGLTDSRQEQLLYPHKRRIVLANEKPREKLLRPDQLLIREGVRRKMRMHRRWVMMMLYGFCDDIGTPWPIWREEQLLRMDKGLHPNKKTDEKSGTGEDGAKWTTLPDKGAT